MGKKKNKKNKKIKNKKQKEKNILIIQNTNNHILLGMCHTSLS